MRRHSIITEDNVFQSVRMFRWVTRSALVMFFGGAEKRIKALEKILPRLEREGALAVDWHRGEKVYSMPRKKKVSPVSMDHEIACADILCRLWRCRMEEGEIFTERAFRGFGIVPEGGIRYSEERNTMLIFEYSTLSNFTHGGTMKSKLTRYKKTLPAMEKKVERNITVLFIIDIERYRVKEFVRRMHRILNEPGTQLSTTRKKKCFSAMCQSLATGTMSGATFPLRNWSPTKVLGVSVLNETCTGTKQNQVPLFAKELSRPKALFLGFGREYWLHRALTRCKQASAKEGGEES